MIVGGNHVTMPYCIEYIVKNTVPRSFVSRLFGCENQRAAEFVRFCNTVVLRADSVCDCEYTALGLIRESARKSKRRTIE